MACNSLPNKPAYLSGLGVENSKNTPSSRESGTFWSSGDGRELYLFGGYSPSTGWEYHADVWAYNVVSEKWRTVKYTIVNSSGNCTGQAWETSPEQFHSGSWPSCRLAATAANNGVEA
jgi:hypothetical protein